MNLVPTVRASAVTLSEEESLRSFEQRNDVT